MKSVPLYALTALVTGLHNFYWLMQIVNGPANIPIELYIPVGFRYDARSRISSALSIEFCRKGWVSSFNFVMGLLRTIDCCQPRHTLFHLA